MLLREGKTAQLFPPAADTWLRLFLLGTAIILLGLALGIWDYTNSSYVTAAGWVEDQVVPFSHKHHVADDGIDCRYCHSGVETSADAGLPSTHVCMTCHSQLWTDAPALAPVRQSYRTRTPIRWKRVAQVPDYVYFNHSIHINRGIGCVECHGRVDKMPLTWRAKPFQMKFCLDCHRDPETHFRPHPYITQMEDLGWSEKKARAFGRQQMARFNIQPAKLDDCGLCHR